MIASMSGVLARKIIESTIKNYEGQFLYTVCEASNPMEYSGR